MNTFAQPISLKRNENETNRTSLIDTVLVVLIAAIVVALLAGTTASRTINSQDAAVQANVAVQEQGVQANALLACVQNHGLGASATSKCRAAAATFASANSSDNPAAFDRAIKYIYPANSR
jgi:hypothetical protein